MKKIDFLGSFVEDGTEVLSYYGKHVVNSLKEARNQASELHFLGAIRIEGVEKADLFVSEDEFETLIKDKEFPLAIIPLA
jgi:hypothetical protein